MAEGLFVKAKQGGKVPYHDRPRAYITDAESVQVPATSYYRRLLKEGSLVIAPAPGVKIEKGGKKDEKKDA